MDSITNEKEKFLSSVSMFKEVSLLPILYFSRSEFLFSKIIGIGNLMIDISSDISKKCLKKYELSLNEANFVNEKNIDFLDNLKNRKLVTYISGGSILNSLRTISRSLNMEEKNKGKFSITILGAIGEDLYKDKIINDLEKEGIKPLIQIIHNISTSKCGVGIYKKKRCLVSQINASKYLKEDFIEENENKIYENDILLIEGYFIKENYEICKNLCFNFKKEKKYIILTLSSVSLVKSHKNKFLEIANESDMIVSNLKEIREFACIETIKEKPEIIFEEAHKKIRKNDRLLVVTDGSNGVYVSKYDYKNDKIDFIIQSFPPKIKKKDIVDSYGVGSAFLGGFLSRYMKGDSLEYCCKIGNDISNIILQNKGCIFPRDKIIKFENFSNIY